MLKVVTCCMCSCVPVLQDAGHQQVALNVCNVNMSDVVVTDTLCCTDSIHIGVARHAKYTFAKQHLDFYPLLLRSHCVIVVGGICCNK